MAKYTGQFLNEAVTNRAQKVQQDQQARQASIINNFENLTPAGNNGVFMRQI